MHIVSVGLQVGRGQEGLWKKVRFAAPAAFEGESAQIGDTTLGVTYSVHNASAKSCIGCHRYPIQNTSHYGERRPFVRVHWTGFTLAIDSPQS
jgi:hypothetical protein